MASNKSSDTETFTTPGGEMPWERKVVEKLLLSTVNESRRTRRWNIFFKILLLGYLFLLLGIALWDGWDVKTVSGEYTALVDLDGVIATQELGVDADHVIEGLKAAFEDEAAKGVILRINSPGGSPVQAANINAEITRLREKNPDKPLYAVVSDICASGGYYVAVAADEIYASPSSIVGSIGVRMDQFGFVDLMEKLGVERRLMTAGENKGILDPFTPLSDADMLHAQSLLDRIHQQFIDTVKEGRGDRLKDDPDIFSGLFWTGDQGLELGLVDGFGDMRFVAREVVGAEDIVDFTAEDNVWERLAMRLGAGFGQAVARMFTRVQEPVGY
jgi:protease-4